MTKKLVSKLQFRPSADKILGNWPSGEQRIQNIQKQRFQVITVTTVPPSMGPIEGEILLITGIGT
jgi:hypothetical protein